MKLKRKATLVIWLNFIVSKSELSANQYIRSFPEILYFLYLTGAQGTEGTLKELRSDFMLLDTKEISILIGICTERIISSATIALKKHLNIKAKASKDFIQLSKIKFSRNGRLEP